MNNTIPVKITFEAIEKAITANCMIDHSSGKPLTLIKYRGGNDNNKGLARLIFIYIARKAGYPKDSICNFLESNKKFYDDKIVQMDDLYKRGKEQFPEGKPLTEDIAVFFYRKLLLVCNYLHTHYGYIVA